jgi:hypothetical protein
MERFLSFHYFQFRIKEKNEFRDKKLYKVRQKLRRKDVKERGLWHKDLMQA